MQNFVKICVYLLFALPTKETKIEFYVKLLSPNMLVPSEKMQLFELYKIMYAVTLNNALSVHEVIKKKKCCFSYKCTDANIYKGTPS